MFSPTIKLPNDPKYASTFKVKIFKDRKTDKYSCNIYDENKAQLPNFDMMQLKGANVMSLVQCTGVWIAGSKFGTTWKLIQARVFPRAKTVRAERVIDLNDAVPGALVDVTQLTYSNAMTMPSGGKIIYINHNNGPFVFETPEMHCPYGASVWQDEKGSKFSLELSFRDADTIPIIKQFQDVVAAFDSKVKSDAISNAWFKTACIYTPISRQNNPAYPPNMKFNIPSEGETLKVKVVNENDEDVELNVHNLLALKGGKVSAVVQCGGVWQVGSRFGVSFKVLKMKVKPSVDALAYNIADDEDEAELAADVVVVDDDEVVVVPNAADLEDV
jgi:hypothetical protein